MENQTNGESLANLEREKDLLEQKIKRIKRNERKGVIREIVKLMQSYEITVNDVQDFIKQRAAKYRDAVTGQTWNGVGKKPSWVQAILEKGGNLDDYLIK